MKLYHFIKNALPQTTKNSHFTSYMYPTKTPCNIMNKTQILKFVNCQNIPRTVRGNDK